MEKVGESENGGISETENWRKGEMEGRKKESKKDDARNQQNGEVQYGTKDKQL
jgi:hypothetical protein